MAEESFTSLTTQPATAKKQWQPHTTIATTHYQAVCTEGLPINIESESIP